MTKIVNDQLVNIIEGLIFASNKPLREEELLKFFEEKERPSLGKVRTVLKTLKKLYEDRGVNLQEVASGFRFQVATEATPWVSKLWDEKPARLSRALLETLALIAYRQPITRGEIEDIRGVVVSTQIVKTLMELAWVRIVGHKEVPGRPALYSTTKEFLDHFSLKSLEALPPLAELRDLEEIAKELDQKLIEENAAVENNEVFDEAQGPEDAEFSEEHAPFEVEATDPSEIEIPDDVIALAKDEAIESENSVEEAVENDQFEEIIMTCPNPQEDFAEEVSDEDEKSAYE